MAAIDVLLYGTMSITLAMWVFAVVAIILRTAIIVFKIRPAEKKRMAKKKRMAEEKDLEDGEKDLEAGSVET